MSVARLAIQPLLDLFTRGFAKVPAAWELQAAEACGLWWRPEEDIVVATPALLRLADYLPRKAEAAGLLLAAEPRFRDPWLRLQAARLAELGRRGAEEELCRAIDALGPAAKALLPRLKDACLEPTPQGPIEVSLFGAPADQPAGGPGLLRVLSLTAHLVEAEQGIPADILPPTDPKDPRENWLAGRLLQAPDEASQETNPYVLCGGLGQAVENRMSWVLGNPWATLLAHLVFLAEAWAAERRGGMVMELPLKQLEHFAAPPEVQVIVTLEDEREVLCGSLGELCLRVLDTLGMSLVPRLASAQLDVRLAPIVGRLIREGVWAYRASARPRYEIGAAFSYDCYRGEGHRYIYRAGERLTELLRSVTVAWARSLTGQPHREATP
jgi:hypothetical protein